jgi:mercury(II) reductase
MTAASRAAPSLDSDCDLLVLGAGSAGFSAAITAAELGARVALVGRGTIGGTCVNVGCLPSKTMMRAAEALHRIGAASRFAGIQGHCDVTDWRAVIGQKDELVASMRHSKYIDLLSAYPSIAYREGTARVTAAGATVNGDTIRAAKTIVATGASAAIPAIPGMESIPYLTSTTALDLERLPGSMLVIGGGYIGCELAQIFARAGVRVTILCRSRLLPKSEPEISHALAEYFGDEGITVRTGVAYRAVRASDAGIALDVAADGSCETLGAEMLLVATGRRPNTTGLGLTEVGVGLNANRGIEVDDRLRTSNPDIYAAGDVTGRDQFVYMAAYGAKLAARNVLNGDCERYDAGAMPTVTFTDPEVAGVGPTEAAARAAGIGVETALLPLSYLPRAIAARDTRGLIKLVADARSGKLLGAHILAPEGGDSIQTAAMAIKTGMTVSALGDMIFPYLTTVEGLKLAAQTFHKDVSKLSCCAG